MVYYETFIAVKFVANFLHIDSSCLNEIYVSEFSAI